MLLSSMSSDSFHVLWNEGLSGSEYFTSSQRHFDDQSTRTPEVDVAMTRISSRSIRGFLCRVENVKFVRSR